MTTPRDELLREYIGYLVSMAANTDQECSKFYADKIDGLLPDSGEAAGEPVAWIKPDWQNPQNYDGKSPVTTYPTSGWAPLYLHPQNLPAAVTDEMVQRACIAYEVEVDGQVYSSDVPSHSMRAALSAAIDITDAVMQPNGACPTCCQPLHVAVTTPESIADWSLRMASKEIGQDVSAGSHGIPDHPSIPPTPAGVPDGWALVPRKAPNGMLDCINAHCKTYEEAQADYAAMLAASPAPPAATDSPILAALDFEPDEQHAVADMANVGHSLMQSIARLMPKHYCWNESPAEVVSDLLNEIENLKEMGAATAPQGEAVECVWRQQDDGYDCYSTSCGHEFRLDDGEQGSMRYCTFCAGPFRLQPWVDEDLAASARSQQAGDTQ